MEKEYPYNKRCKFTKLQERKIKAIAKRRKGLSENEVVRQAVNEINGEALINEWDNKD